MVEAESPFRTLLFYKKSKRKGNVALCRTSFTSVARRRHKGLDLRVIMSCQTVVTFSSKLRHGIFSTIERLCNLSSEGPKLEIWTASPKDCMAQLLCDWLRATLLQQNKHLTHIRSLCRISASCCCPVTAEVRFRRRAEYLTVGLNF